MGTESAAAAPVAADDEWTDEVRGLLTPTIASVDAIERQGTAAEQPPRTRPLNILLVLAHNPHIWARSCRGRRRSRLTARSTGVTASCRAARRVELSI